MAKAFLYTDRSVYRPGESCAMRAVLRDVEQGIYVLPEQKNYVLDWLDGSGRVVASRKQELGEFGTGAARFDVPAQASPGRFSLRLRRESDGRVLATHAVQVAQFEPPRISLSLETERKVLVRGEKIEGKVVARFARPLSVQGSEREVLEELFESIDQVATGPLSGIGCAIDPSTSDVSSE